MTNGNNTQAAYTEMAQEWQKMMLDTWQVWTKAMVESDTFSSTSSAVLDWNLAAQKQMREMSGQYMDALEIPRRSDFARLSAQVLSVEQRLADSEDERDDLAATLDEVKSLLVGLASDVAELKGGKATTTGSKPAAKKKSSTKKSSKATTTKKENSN